MLVIGLTGGVGCGKSTVLELLRKNFSCLCLSTDDISRRQMQAGEKVYLSVVREFGNEIVNDYGEIDRKKLASVVFSDEEKLKKLNSLTHPAVTQEVLSCVKRERERNEYDLLVIETALLIEGGYDRFCDQVWYVFAPEEERRQRLKSSRGYSEEKITDLFEKQQKEESFLKVADGVINNCDGTSEQEILKQINKLLKNS